MSGGEVTATGGETSGAEGTSRPRRPQRRASEGVGVGGSRARSAATPPTVESLSREMVGLKVDLSEMKTLLKKLAAPATRKKAEKEKAELTARQMAAAKEAALAHIPEERRAALLAMFPGGSSPSRASAPSGGRGRGRGTGSSSASPTVVPGVRGASLPATGATLSGSLETLLTKQAQTLESLLTAKKHPLAKLLDEKPEDGPGGAA